MTIQLVPAFGIIYLHACSLTKRPLMAHSNQPRVWSSLRLALWWVFQYYNMHGANHLHLLHVMYPRLYVILLQILVYRSGSIKGSLMNNVCALYCLKTESWASGEDRSICAAICPHSYPSAGQAHPNRPYEDIDWAVLQNWEACCQQRQKGDKLRYKERCIW